MATLAVAPVENTNVSGNASLTLPACVANGTIIFCVGSEFTNNTPGAVCTGNTPAMRAAKVATNWGGTNFMTQFGDFTPTSSGDKIITLTGFGVGEISQMFAMQFNETLVYDNGNSLI